MNILSVSMARKNLTTSIENDLQKEIKKLAIDLERPFNDLIEEALTNLLEKYEQKAKKQLSNEKFGQTIR